MNNQHKVQKCRDLLWSLTALPHEHNLDYDNLVQKALREFNMYCDISNESNDFTRNITKLCRMGLAYICLVWISCIFFLNWNDIELIYVLNVTIPAIFILIGFFVAFGKLNSLTIIGDIPKGIDLLNTASAKTGETMLVLASSLIRLRIYDIGEENLRLCIELPIPFYNFSISPYLIALDPESFSQQTLKCEEINSLGNDYIAITEDRLILRNFRFYNSEIYQFQIPKHIINSDLTTLQIQLDINNSTNYIIVTYSTSLTDIYSIDIYNPLTLTPNDLTDPFSYKKYTSEREKSLHS